jgi:hypothetical protein
MIITELKLSFLITIACSSLDVPAQLLHDQAQLCGEAPEVLRRLCGGAQEVLCRVRRVRRVRRGAHPPRARI